MVDRGICVRFANVREAIGLSQQELSKKIRIPIGNINDIERFRREPSKAVIAALSLELQVNANWLLTGIGEMFILKMSSEQKRTSKEAVFDPNTGKVSTLYNRILTSQIALIPLGGEIAAGEPAECYPDPDAEPLSIPNILLKDSPAMYCILRVSGNSMEPVVLSNDLVLIHYCREWSYAEGKISAIRIDGEITLKEVQLDPVHKLIYLHPYNHSHKMIVVNPEDHQDVFLIGVMEMLIRSIEQ